MHLICGPARCGKKRPAFDLWARDLVVKFTTALHLSAASQHLKFNSLSDCYVDFFIAQSNHYQTKQILFGYGGRMWLRNNSFSALQKTIVQVEKHQVALAFLLTFVVQFLWMPVTNKKSIKHSFFFFHRWYLTAVLLCRLACIIIKSLTNTM